MLVLNLMCSYFVEALEEFQFRARMIERNTSSTLPSRGALGSPSFVRIRSDHCDEIAAGYEEVY